MPPSSAPTNERILTAAQAAATARHGEKGSLVSAACAATGQSRATVYRQLRQLTVRPERAQREDKNSTSLTREEAQAISALVMNSHRKNNKQLLTVARALDVLRYDGVVRAERVVPGSGEVLQLSAEAVERALRIYGLHPKQLLRPAPSVELKSLHANHVWQIDASLCVLYYLRCATARDAGLQVLDADKFYKNKPAALARVENERVWRYVVTDHYSGSIFANYVLGAESGLNLAESFIEAIVQREYDGQADPFHGVPRILMMDMGSANTSGLFKNLARRLDVKLIAHAPGNARATGQVEKAQDIVERQFESALKLQPVASLDELNSNARFWARYFNATAIHSRHGRSRTDVWLTIAQDQLRIAPPVELCRELLTHEPVERKVSVTLTVQFNGREFDVRHVPDVMVGAKLLVTHNPYQLDAACIVGFDADGNEELHSAPLIERDDAGFRADAKVIDEGYAKHADTLADTNRKLIERTIMEAPTDAAAQAARKAKTLPFGGRIDPLREARETVLPAAIGKRGELLVVGTKTAPVEIPRLDAVSAMLRLVGAIGRHLSADEHAFFKARYADGVPEDQIDALIAQFIEPQQLQQPQQAAGGLRAV